MTSINAGLGGEIEMKRIFATIAVLVMVFCVCVPVLADPVTDLGDAVVYWQELALSLSMENSQLKADNERLTAENEALKADVEDSMDTMSKLKDNLTETAALAREAEALRVQADADLTSALAQIKVLEELVKKLSGPRFGALLGATYVKGEYGVIAGISMGL